MIDNRSNASRGDFNDDFSFCSNLYDQIYKDRSPHATHLSLYNEHERVLILVFVATGSIGNGGFHFLFEAYWLAGDPTYAKTVAAFTAIGAHQCASAFRKALNVFPSTPPVDVVERTNQFEAAPEELRNAIDEEFLAVEEEIATLLANYIRRHKNSFEMLRAK
jgi:uncharacterized protein DUF4375